jgi:hypothetical protein
MANGQLYDWWPAIVDHLPASRQKEANSIIMFVLRAFWLEGNERVFNTHSSMAVRVLASVLGSWDSWAVGRGRPQGDVT